MNLIKYEEFLKRFNAFSDPYRCSDCGSKALLFKEPHARHKLRQWCKQELKSKLWREVTLSIVNPNHEKFLREQKHIGIKEMADRLHISQSYLRYLCYTGQIPFLRIKSRIKFEDKMIETIQLYLSETKRTSKKKDKTA